MSLQEHDVVGSLTRQLSATQADLRVAREQALTMHKQMEEAQRAERQARVDLRAAQEAHAADIKLIGQRAAELAKSEDWCETYDETIADLNNKLTIKLPLRSVRYRVDVVVSTWVKTPEGLEPAGQIGLERVRDALKDARLTARVRLDEVENVDDEDDDE